MGLSEDSAGNYTKAIDYFSRAIEQEPALAVAWYDRGVSRMNARQYSLAVVDFNKCIYLDTSLTEAWYNRHLAYRYTSNYQFALADVSYYLDRFPADTQARIDRYNLAAEMKEWDVAEKDLKWIIAGSREPLVFQEALARLYLKMEKHEAAEKLYDNMLSEHPDDPSVLLGRAYLRNHMEKFEASMEDINMYLLRMPRDKDALKLKADNFFFMKDFASASAIYGNLLQTDTLNAGLMADYGHCLLQQKKYAEAETVLTRAIRQKNDAPAYAYLGRGLARYNLGRGQEACEDWQKSKMLGEVRALTYLEQYCKP